MATLLSRLKELNLTIDRKKYLKLGFVIAGHYRSMYNEDPPKKIIENKDKKMVEVNDFPDSFVPKMDKLIKFSASKSKNNGGKARQNKTSHS